jgi:PAS domain S-box-containing protein
MNEKRLDIPFIIVSGKIGEEAAIDVLRRGAYDYVSKDNLSRIGQAIRHALEAKKRKVEAAEAAEALRASEAKYRAFADSSQDVVFIKDSSCRYIMTNKAAESLYGRPEAEILGRTSAEILPPDTAATCMKSDRAALAGSSVVKTAERYRGRIFETRKFPFRMGAETMIGCYIRDITEQSIAESELEMEVKIGAILRENHTRESIMSAVRAMLERMEGIVSVRFGDGPGSLERDAATGPGMVEMRLPMETQNRRLGDLVILRREEPEADELDILRLVAGMVANALHVTDLREETEDRLRKITALSLIDESIGGAVDLETTLELALDQAMAMLKADAATIFLLGEDGANLRLAVAKGFRDRRKIGEIVPLGQAYVGLSAAEKRTISVYDFSALDSDTAFAAMLHTEGFRSFHCTPLVVQSKVLGVMGIYPRNPLVAGPDWLGFFETIARLAAIAIDNKTMYRNQQKAQEELAVAYDATIEGWSRAMDLRDKDTEGHSRRVTGLALELASRLGIEGEALVHIRRGALLHDIGKVGIPDSVLLKPGPLTEEEWTIMKRHPQFASEMLSPVSYLRPALEIPYSHHEKWDGTGYPLGLAGEAIPIAARIFAIIDVWDALTSDRPYRNAWPAARALEHIKSQIGKHFDPRVGAAFIGMIDSSSGGLG